MSTAKTYSRKEFIDEYGSFIQKEIQGTGILFGTLVAQAIIESQGKVGSVYRVGGSTLSKQANNYFGIKKSSSWKGKTFNIDTGEVFNGNKVTVNADFRAYNNVKDSIKDYVKFLHENKRYKDAGVFKAKTVLAQGQALKNAGYATALNYPTTINKVYESVKPYIVASEKKYKKTRVLKVIGFSVAFISLVTLVAIFSSKSKK